MNTDLDTNERTSRDILTSCICKKMNRERLDRALSMSNRNGRSDAVECVIRDAVTASPIVSFSGIPHVYSHREGIYMKFDYYDFKMAIYDSMRRVNVPDGYYGSIDRIVKLCWAETQSRKRSVDNSVVVMKNGVYDTMDSTLKEYKESYMANTKVDYDYNPNERAVGWLAFLNDVLPDHEMQMLLQEFIAAAYVDRKLAKIEYVLILLGKGSNGKSVVFEVISSLIGAEAISNFSIADLITNGRRDQNIATCNGKRLNYCSEIRTTEISEKNSDAFKSLVSGEPQMARSLYREPFKAADIPLIMANANKLPKLVDASTAIQRRMLIIPFETYIPEEKQNVELATELAVELPGIFNWVMEGLARLKRNKYKLAIPDRVKHIVAEYVKNNNLVSRWADERKYFARYNINMEQEEKFKQNQELFDDFIVWCKENNEAVRTKREFIAEFEAEGFERVRRCNGYGFVFFTPPDPEAVRVANMDIAIKMQSQIFLESLKEAATSGKQCTVKGVEELERYLGLPKDCIWPYLRSGMLDGTYTNLGKGQPIFNVIKVQTELARNGFYAQFIKDSAGCRRKASAVLKGLRETFNSQMRMMNVPIRKFGNVHGYVPMNDRNCWVVPDDWEYSKRAAELVMMQPKTT